jgi:hypothetical protein
MNSYKPTNNSVGNRKFKSFRELAEYLKQVARNTPWENADESTPPFNNDPAQWPGAETIPEQASTKEQPRAFGSFRELGKQLRNQAFQEFAQNRLMSQDEPSLSASAHGGNSRADSSPLPVEIGYGGLLFGGNIKNNTYDTLYVAGEPGSGKGSMIIELHAGNSDPSGFDADFVKLGDTWFKIRGPVTITDDEHSYHWKGWLSKADPDVAAGYQHMLDEYLANKEGEKD